MQKHTNCLVCVRDSKAGALCEFECEQTSICYNISMLSQIRQTLGYQVAAHTGYIFLVILGILLLWLKLTQYSWAVIAPAVGLTVFFPIVIVWTFAIEHIFIFICYKKKIFKQADIKKDIGYILLWLFLIAAFLDYYLFGFPLSKLFFL